MARHFFRNRTETRLRAFWRILIQTLLMVFLVLGAALAVVPLAGPVVGSIIASLIGFTLSVWMAGRYVDHRRFTGFGFHLTPRWWADFGFGLLLGTVLMGGVFLVERQMGWIAVQDTVQDWNPDVPFLASLLGAFLIYTAIGFYEELLSRGYHVKNIAEGLHLPRISPSAAIWLAVGISSLAFGLGHAFNPNASAVSTVNIMAAGLFLGLGYVLTGELGLSIGLHISWNFAQGALFGFPVSGSSSHTLAKVFVVYQTGPVLWTGGGFGPEAGLLGLLAMATGAALIVGWVRLRYGHVQAAHRLAEPPGSRETRADTVTTT